MIKNGKTETPWSERTRLVHLGRDPQAQFGFVNPPIYRGSTVLFPTVDSLKKRDQAYFYGRKGTPTLRALEEALTALEDGADTVLAPSGLAAITCALMALVKQGDHILITDSAYGPTRHFADAFLSGLGVETTYYDPLMGADIASLFRDNTTLVFTESPGSLSFEIQDIPAIVTAAHAHGARVVMDNTWATPLFFKPLTHGVDVVIHSATKYITGHADSMLGAITSAPSVAEQMRKTHEILGLCPGTEEANLGLRGLRSLATRLAQHERAAWEMAQWLAERPEVAKVLHPAMPDHPGHAIWKRDFSGASGLFSVILKPVSDQALAAFLDGLELFGMGWSWGGFESLAVPFDLAPLRTATPSDRFPAGPGIRFHIGLENPEDLKADLAAGFTRLRQT